MHRANLYSKASQPPPMGSPRDRILMELFFREKSLEKEKYEVLFGVLAKMIHGKIDNPAIESFTALINKVTGAHWMIDKKKEAKNKQLEDVDMLQKLKTLQPKVNLA